MGVLTEVILLLWYLLEAFLESVLPFIFLRKKYPLHNKTVVITGAASGIGRLMALQAAAKNNLIVLVDINEQPLKEVAEEIKAMGQKCHIQVCDVSKKDEVVKAAQSVKAAVGEVDVLINNAGVAVMRSLLDQTDAEIDRTLQINLYAHFWTLRSFLPDMIARRSGHIVSVSSVAGLAAAPNLSAYCASKFGVVGLHESLRLELDVTGLGNKIGMTLVCPYFINTRLLQGAHSGRLEWLLPNNEPEEVARRVIHAIEYKREMLLLPWMINLLYVNHGILPVKANVQVSNLFGVNDGMKNASQSSLVYLPK